MDSLSSDNQNKFLSPVPLPKGAGIWLSGPKCRGHRFFVTDPEKNDVS